MYWLIIFDKHPAIVYGNNEGDAIQNYIRFYGETESLPLVRRLDQIMIIDPPTGGDIALKAEIVPK